MTALYSPFSSAVYKYSDQCVERRTKANLLSESIMLSVHQIQLIIAITNLHIHVSTDNEILNYVGKQFCQCKTMYDVCKYMKHIFELRMKDQIEERSSSFLLFDLSSAVHIYVSYIYIHLFILHRYITNSQYDQLPVGLIAQLVEHCTSIAEVMGSNPVQA